jgi:hypothetical protein
MTAINIALDEESFSQYTACTALEVAHEMVDSAIDQLECDINGSSLRRW